MDVLSRATQRVLLPFWVGAATLFVVTSVAEQRFDGFSSAMKNQLALIRFPKYYATGFAAVGLACMAGALDALEVTGDIRDFLDARFAHVADFMRNR